MRICLLSAFAFSALGADGSTRGRSYEISAYFQGATRSRCPAQSQRE
jgi:hypothetical protein